MNIIDSFHPPRNGFFRRPGINLRRLPSRLSLAALVVALGLIPTLFSFSEATATSVNRLAICDLEGRPGDVINTEVILEGTDPGERSGLWTTHYKAIDGDSEMMDITSWISFEPSSEYTIAQGETKSFVVRITVPDNAQPGLWGATAADAGLAGHSDDRRTYVIFKDSDAGSLYSGLLIPISVNVIGKANAFTPVATWIKDNVIVSILILVVIVLLAVLGNKRRHMKAGS